MAKKFMLVRSIFGPSRTSLFVWHSHHTLFYFFMPHKDEVNSLRKSKDHESDSDVHVELIENANTGIMLRIPRRSSYCSHIHPIIPITAPRCLPPPRHLTPSSSSSPFPQLIFAFEKSISGCIFLNPSNISAFFCSSLVGFPNSFCL